MLIATAEDATTAHDIRHCCVLELRVCNEASAALDVWLGPRVSPAAATPVWQEALAYGARLPSGRGEAAGLWCPLACITMILILGSCMLTSLGQMCPECMRE